MKRRTLGSRSTADEVVAGADLSERTMLVTGCSGGIGFETARSLAAAGARVVLACRNEQSGKRTSERIRELVRHARLELVEIDLGSLRSIHRCVEQLPVDRLDAVICNAGLFQPRYEATVDGIESTVGVCHFGHFLLVALLREQLRRAAPSRVVVVASESHRHPSRLDFDRFPLSRERYRGLIAYGQAKLCNVLFANELTRRCSAEGITASSLHPGSLIPTEISRHSLLAKLAIAAARPFAKSVQQGAATSVYCAVAPELEGIGGRYYADCAEKPASRGARDPEAARRLWELSAARVGVE